MPKSTDFEKLVAKIVEELEPTVVVKWNDHILGRKSGLNRQIDVSIRRTDPDTLGVIDAKDHGRPADVGKIDALASVMRDVGANYGALVCSGGFAKSIRQYARNSGISLFSVHDAASVNWSLELKVPIIWTELTPHVWLSGALHAEAGDSFVDDDPHGMQVTLDGGLTKIDPVDTFARLWAEGSINRGVGQVHRLAPEGPVQAFVLDHADQKQLRPVKDYAIAYVVEPKLWLGRFQPDECRGLIDVLDEDSFTASYLPDSAIPMQRDERWEPVTEPQKLALTPRGTVVVCEQPVLVSDGKVENLEVKYLGP